MEENLTQKAVDLAIKCNWTEAIKINLKILKSNSNDIEALNRLSRSYYENGNTVNAKKTSLKVIKIDPNNNIALKAIEKYKQVKTSSKRIHQNVDPSVFIEKPGKTKLINLINVGSESTCSCLNSGDEIFLTTHTHRVSLTDFNGKYIGKLPDDLSSRLRKFIKGGNEYKVYVKSTINKNVKVFIKEISQGIEFKNIQSFPRDVSESISENLADSEF